MRKISLIFVLAFLLAGCAQPPPDGNELEQKWAAIKAEQDSQVWVSSEFQQPQNLGAPINTIGWEDGAYITGDGSKLYISYFGGDLINYIAHGLSHEYLRGPNRGFRRAQVDVLVAEKAGSIWGEPVLDAISEDIWSEGGVMLSNGNKYYMTNKEFQKDQIYRNGIRFDFQDTSKDYGDPHYCAAKDELYFWMQDNVSSTPVLSATSSIYVYKNNTVSKLPAPINTGTKDYQPFLTSDCQTLYFTSDRGGKAEIYRSTRLGESTWAEPEKIVSSLYGVGEPTLTNDGKQLYFVIIYHDNNLGYDADIMIAQRK